MNSRQVVMQPVPDAKILAAWRRITEWVSRHHSFARLVSLTASLVVFFLVLPGHVRTIFWDGLRSHQLLASMLFIFSLLAISLIWTTGQNIDAWAFLLFNLRGSRPIWLDKIMLTYTQIGSGIAGLAFALILFLTGDRRLSYELILGSLTLWLVVELLKFMVHRSRPFIRLVQARIVGYPAGGRSFPSGHTSQAFFMATLISQYFHASIGVVFLLYSAAFLVGITRMYVGAHYPRDVLAGAVLGSAWGLVGGLLDGYGLYGIG